MEEIYSDSNKVNTQVIKNMREKMVKLIQDSLKAQKQAAIEEANREQQDRDLNNLKKDIKGSIGKKEILKNMCNSLLDRSHEIYYEHVKVVQE